jgi:hypothetical protein
VRAVEASTEENLERRRQHEEWLQTVDGSRVFAIDESGSHIAMTPATGWCPRGERLADVVPRNRGTVRTMLGALNVRDGLTAVMTVEGGTSGDVFFAYALSEPTSR